jgi:hypothetical protein
MGVALVWCLPRPFSQNTAFSKKALKPTFFFLHFWYQFYRAFQWFIVCFHNLSGFWDTEGNVSAVPSQLATTVLSQ